MKRSQTWFNILFPQIDHSVRYNPAIDGLRGIAVGLVVLFHIYPDYFSFGFAGVDIFFVISGFLITQIIIQKASKNNFSYKEFYRNRVRRIFPAMLFVLLFLYAVAYLFMFPNELKEFSSHIVWAGAFSENWKLFKEADNYWDIGSFFKPILHYWSLSIEEQFYLIWPAIILLIIKSKLKVEYWLITIFIIDFFIPQFFNISSYYHSLSRFWELMGGGIAAAFVSAHNRYNKLLLIAEKNSHWIFLLFIISTGLLTNSQTFHYYRLLFLIFSVALLIISVHKTDKLKVLSSKILVSIGMISYSLYLWHYPVISFLKYIFGIEINGVSLIVISLVISYLSYRFVELPFRKSNSYRTSIFLLICLLIIISIAFYTFKSNGLKNRKHIMKNEHLYTQLEWKARRNTDGEILFKKISGYTPTTDYIQASGTDTSKKFILIIGDSHAAVAYPGIKQVARQYGIETVLLSNSGCAPFIYRDTNNECQKKNSEIFKFINTFKSNITSIIFVSRIYNLFVHYEKNHELLDFMQLFHNTFQYYSQYKIPFYFILQPPEINFSPSYCIPRPFNLIPVKSPFIDISIYNQQKKYHKIIYNIAAQYPNIYIYNPEKIFCDNKYCYVVRNEKLLYYDDDHISTDGSVLLGEHLIKEILKKYPHKTIYQK